MALIPLILKIRPILAGSGDCTVKNPAPNDITKVAIVVMTINMNQ